MGDLLKFKDKAGSYEILNLQEFKQKCVDFRRKVNAFRAKHHKILQKEQSTELEKIIGFCTNCIRTIKLSPEVVTVDQSLLNTYETIFQNTCQEVLALNPSLHLHSEPINIKDWRKSNPDSAKEQSLLYKGLKALLKRMSTLRKKYEGQIDWRDQRVLNDIDAFCDFWISSFEENLPLRNIPKGEFELYKKAVSNIQKKLKKTNLQSNPEKSTS